jgi:hypothetical protein
MTKEELKSGAIFKYGNTKYYSMFTSDNGDMIICQFGTYIANVESVGNRFIKAYTYIMNKKVNLKIDISECKVMC